MLNDIDFQKFLKAVDEAKKICLNGKSSVINPKVDDASNWFNVMDLIICLYNSSVIKKSSVKKELMSFYHDVTQIDEILKVLEELGRDVSSEIYDVLKQCHKQAGDNDE